jgi:hypothetical protein
MSDGGIAGARSDSRARPRPTSTKTPRPLPHHPTAVHEEDPGEGADLVVAFEAFDNPEDDYWREVYGDMLRESLPLFARDILGMEVAPHLMDWGDAVNEHSRLAILAARDHGKSAFFSYAYPIWRAWSEPGCEVYLFSRTLEQAQEFLDIIMWGRNNLRGLADIPELSYMVPTQEDFRTNPRVRLNRSDVVFTNGSRIRAVGYGKAIRGRHPKYVVLDDVLNDNDMWSETERNKNISYFQSAIVNMVMPATQFDGYFEGGQCIVVGTPYHMADLYAWLEKNEVYCYLRYPGILTDETTGKESALFPWRWSLEQLHHKKKEIGSVAFSREILCLPITDDISIFPSYLFPPLYDDKLTLRPTKEEIRQRGWDVYFGVDIARSASVGADYFVIFAMAKDRHGMRYLVDIHRSQGLPFRQQLEQISIMADRYNPSLVFIESNAMQQIYTDEMRRMTDIPVKEFVTTAVNKYPLDKGVPGLRIVLENQKLIIPKGDEYSRGVTAIWEAEASQFGYVEGKLQGIGTHDDTVMAWWFAEEAIKAGGFSFAFGDEDGQDAFDTPEGEDDEDYADILLGDPDERGESEASLF